MTAGPRVQRIGYSDPTKPGSDAWAGLYERSVQTWNRAMAPLRREMVAIRRFVAATWGSRGYTGPTQRETRRRERAA